MPFSKSLTISKICDCFEVEKLELNLLPNLEISLTSSGIDVSVKFTIQGSLSMSLNTLC